MSLNFLPADTGISVIRSSYMCGPGKLEKEHELTYTDELTYSETILKYKKKLTT